MPEGNLKHWPTCPECGTEGPHTIQTRVQGYEAGGPRKEGDRILNCMMCHHKWNHDLLKREMEVNWAWVKDLPTSGTSK